MKVRLSKRAALLAAAALVATGALATAALAANASSKSFNWSTAKSAKAGGGMKALVKAAKKEGTLNVIALPTNWANYGVMLNTFHRIYGIKIHSDNPSGSSAQEIQAIKSLKGRSSAPDVVDVGGPFASAGASQGLLAPYKVTTWKNIPKNQKASNGMYYQDYGGFISFGCNMNLLGATPCPTSWSALKSSKYKNDVALNGSPLSANAALSAVWAAAVNNGGSSKNIAPGVDFFKALMSSGNFNSTDCNAASVIATSCPITINWDYLNTAGAWGLTGSTHWKVIDPKGIPFGGFYDQAVSKYAPHPAAARLWEEFLYSVKGQNIWLKGGARPVELAAMVAAGTANKAAYKALPKVTNLSKAVVPTTAQSTTASAYVTSNWP
ncbi:MAG TPA: ABC transporter substrate-binding protein [Gaiellaceae bacterium]|nr:ABC transporter substrate-binding protein [Gaiellaceae bacterium]